MSANTAEKIISIVTVQAADRAAAVAVALAVVPDPAAARRPGPQPPLLRDALGLAITKAEAQVAVQGSARQIPRGEASFLWPERP